MVCVPRPAKKKTDFANIVGVTKSLAPDGGERMGGGLRVKETECQIGSHRTGFWQGGLHQVTRPTPFVFFFHQKDNR